MPEELSSYMKLAIRLSAAHTGPRRPAWQCLPEVDLKGPCRRDYLNKGFSILDRRPDRTHWWDENGTYHSMTVEEYHRMHAAEACEDHWEWKDI